MRAADRGRRRRRVLATVSVWGAMLGSLASFSPVLEAQSSALAEAQQWRRALRAFEAACQRDGAVAWGRSLCGPVMLVDRGSRAIIANRRDAHRALVANAGAWEGRLPESHLVANTAIQWSGTRWAMVMLPLPTDDFGAIALLGHESFHRLQPSLGMTIVDAPAPHLDEREGRLWLRLELRALAYALTTTGAAARTHARAAMRFRDERRRRYPGSAMAEDALERAEGTAEYSGMRLAVGATPMGMLRVVRHMDGVERGATLVRAFPYATGPALGFLLDRWAPGWQGRVARGAAPGQLLRASSGSAVGDAEEIARAYGWASIGAEEEGREQRRRETIARYRAALVDGPRVVIPGDGVQRSFDPNTLVPLDGMGIVHPTGSFSGPWGTLEVTGGSGALLSGDYRTLVVAAPDEGGAGSSPIRGDGWVLTLADGWTIRQSAGKGGDLEVVKR